MKKILIGLIYIGLFTMISCKSSRTPEQDKIYKYNKEAVKHKTFNR